MFFILLTITCNILKSLLYANFAFLASVATSSLQCFHYQCLYSCCTFHEFKNHPRIEHHEVYRRAFHEDEVVSFPSCFRSVVDFSCFVSIHDSVTLSLVPGWYIHLFVCYVVIQGFIFNFFCKFLSSFVLFACPLLLTLLVCDRRACGLDFVRYCYLTPYVRFYPLSCPTFFSMLCMCTEIYCIFSFLPDCWVRKLGFQRGSLSGM